MYYINPLIAPFNGAAKNFGVHRCYHAQMSGRMKLCVGCSRNIVGGWINVDRCLSPGADIVANLESRTSRNMRLRYL
jgi:hypothetical protein